MTKLPGALVVAVLVGLLALWVSLPTAAAVEGRAAQPEGEGPVAVVLDRTKVEVGPGERVRFTSTVRNTGGETLGDLVAHVAILTTDPDVYVDPEDWSPRRTQYVDRLGPGDEATITWNVQAVTAGPLILFVGVTDLKSDTVTVSNPLSMTVTGRREVNSEDALPLVAGVPAGVLLLLILTGVRHRLRR